MTRQLPTEPGMLKLYRFRLWQELGGPPVHEPGCCIREGQGSYCGCRVGYLETIIASGDADGARDRAKWLSQRTTDQELLTYLSALIESKTPAVLPPPAPVKPTPRWRNPNAQVPGYQKKKGAAPAPTQT